KSLVERHNLGVSSATVRNDMSALEEEGFIAQPHTSAGRIPTDKGYRLFVDRLSAVKPLSLPERRAIENFLKGAVDLDDVLRRTVRLLAQLTRQVAVVQYPRISGSEVRHVEVVPLSTTRLLLVLIIGNGRVEQRSLDLPDGIDEDSVRELRDALNARVAGRGLADAAAALAELPEALAPARRTVAQLVASTLIEALVESPEERVVLAGTANLARAGTDFSTVVQPILEALEEQVVLLTLLGEASDPSLITVRIGEENPHQLRTASLVTTGYGAGGQALASLGVLGPTRMDYPGTMGAVRAVARYVGRILAEH
ncbi:MAG: heat-inducible transcriptional repressor HrcA, partial [Mycobacteriales bacterium]